MKMEVIAVQQQFQTQYGLGSNKIRDWTTTLTPPLSASIKNNSSATATTTTPISVKTSTAVAAAMNANNTTTTPYHLYHHHHHHNYHHRQTATSNKMKNSIINKKTNRTAAVESTVVAAAAAAAANSTAKKTITTTNNINPTSTIITTSTATNKPINTNNTSNKNNNNNNNNNIFYCDNNNIDVAAVNELSLRLLDELRAAKSRHLTCTEVSLPCDLTPSIAAEIIRVSEREPCGIHGCTIYIEFEDEPNNSRRIASLKLDQETVSTFEIYLTLRQDHRGWAALLPQFMKSLARTITISPEFTITKHKLYSPQQRVSYTTTTTPTTATAAISTPSS